MIFSKWSIALIMLTICGNTFAKCVFKTGFEQKNEPFGNFQTGLKSLPDNGWKFTKAQKGKQSLQIVKLSNEYGQVLSPGSGNGKYGAYLSKSFLKSSADKLYFSFDLKINNPNSSGYLAFVYLFGNNSGKKKLNGRSLTMLIYGGKLVFPGNVVIPFTASPKWTKFQFALNFKTSQFDCIVNGENIRKNIPFRNKGIMNIGKIVLGGGAPKESVFYDNIYLENEAEKSIAKSVSKPKLPLAAINQTSVIPVIDGKLSDKCWKQASKLTPFFLPSGNKLAKKQSVAMACYDKKNLYIAIKCYEPRLDPVLNQLDLIKTKQTRRDSAVWTDDSVEIFIRPDISTGKYFQMAINSAGTIFDTALPSPGVNWSSKAIIKTSRNTKFWSIEMAIPLKTLTSNINIENTVWQMNFCRNRSNPNENSCWAPTFGRFNNIGHFGKIIFSKNIPALNLKQIPAQIHKGSNSIELDLFSPYKTTVCVQTSLKYGREEINTEAVNILLSKTKLKNIKKEFIYYPDTKNRKNTKSIELTYTVAQNGNIIYNSPRFPYSVSENSIFKTSFIAQTSRILTKKIETIYINKAGARTVYLLIQAAKKAIGKFDKLTTVIELPASVKIINPLSSNKAINPDSFTQKTIITEKKKYNRYKITWDKKYIYQKGSFSRKNSYRFPLLLVMQADNNAKIGNYKLKIHSEAKIDNKREREKPSILTLTILNAINGKAPKKIPVISWGAKNNLIYASLNTKERKAFIGNRVKAGFNTLGLNELGGSFMSEQEQKEIKNQGFKLIGAIPRNSCRTYRSNAFPGAIDFLKKHPEYRSLNGEGKTQVDCICITELLNKKGLYRKEFEKWLMPLAKKYKYLVWDYEVRPANNFSTCWCAQCLKRFSKFIKTPTANLNTALIRGKYRNEWVQFQCQRNAALAKVMKNIIKQSAPECKFSVYSGYQSKHTQNSYGVDWNMLKDSIDFAMCGYGRPLFAINATLDAISPKKLIGGLLIFVWYNSSYSMDDIKIDLYRRLTDSRGGIMLFYDIQADGRMWSAVGEMTKLINANETFFLTCKREFGKIKVISGKLENITVLKGKSGKRIIFVFNPSISSKTVKFKFNDREFNISIHPKDIKTIIIK